jgi:acetylornithine/succinyldiaminopimelate/putrescine aminotransferase
VAAVADQARALFFQSNASRLTIRDAAAEKLADFAPSGLGRVFFVNSGAEANENALRIALTATGRSKVVSIEHGFHGRTAAASAATFGSSKWYGFPRTPMDVVFVPRDDNEALAAAIDADTAAVILEPVQGLAGAYALSAEFVRTARRECDRAGALLILDEVQTGMGRLGASFGAELLGVTPDLLTVAKGLAGGLPAGAVVMRPELASELKPGQLGTTFGGGPVACAGIVAVIDTLLEDGLIAKVPALEEQVRLTCQVGPVVGIQGRGLLLGLRTTPCAADVRDALLARDILTGTSADPHVLRLLPPLVLEPEHIQRLATALGDLNDA